MRQGSNVDRRTIYVQVCPKQAITHSSPLTDLCAIERSPRPSQPQAAAITHAIYTSPASPRPLTPTLIVTPPLPRRRLAFPSLVLVDHGYTPTNMATASAPFKFARIASLILSSVFGIVGLALGVDALVKGNHEKERIQSLVPRGTTVDIDTHDVVTVGAVVSAFSAALGVASLASLALLLAALVTAKSGPTLASRTLSLQGVLLSILTLGLFGALVPMTDYVANREAKVTAKIGRLTLPPSIVQSVQDAIGATSVYHEISYRERFVHPVSTRSVC